MNNYLKSFFASFVLIALLSLGVTAAEKGKSETVTIKTSAICGSCKARIEKVVKATAGVEEALLNLNNKKLKIKFNPQVTNADKLREVISAAGYDADAVKKNETAFEKLPACCQKPMEGDMH